MAASAGLLALLGVEDDYVLAQAHDHARQGTDPILRLFIRESVAIRREIRRDRLRGEHARRHAAALRMVATYGQHARLDATVRSQLRDRVREQGREAMLRAPVDHDRAVAELRALGTLAPEELPDANLLTREERLAGLDELLRNGITPMLTSQLEMVDRGARALDRYGSLGGPAAVPVAFSQISREQCDAAWESQILMMKASAVFICMMPPLWELCVIWQLDILMMEALQWYICSDNP